MIQATPFLYWVGGKKSILKELNKRLPKYYNKYYEPFLGGAALFFNTQASQSYLSDINYNLITTYKVVRDNIDELIVSLNIHKNNHNKEYYLKARDDIFTEKDPILIAALFIYLNKSCYNGLYRVNKSGRFNVPIGSRENPNIFDEDNLRNVSKVLQNVNIQHCSFSDVQIQKGSFYYLDPPYYKTYSRYNHEPFKENNHKELSEFCDDINNQGAYFMLSNSNTDFVKNLYRGYHIEEVLASRFISCKSDGRKKAKELIITNY